MESLAPEKGNEPVVLKGWPSCINCLSCSTDGEIAIALGKNVHILSPRETWTAGPFEEGFTTGPRNWHSTRVCTNVFTTAEWPNQEPDSTSHFSIGEEQSVSTVTNLAWSPAGLGPHQRCVLAVLTSNLVLSLWESDGTIGQWERVSVVNNALGNSFALIEQARPGFHRAKRRIRAFAWAPTLTNNEPGAKQMKMLKRGIGHLAIVNDDGDIIVIHISRVDERHKFETEAIWPLSRFFAFPDYKLPLPSSLFARAMAAKNPVLDLSWSTIGDSLHDTCITVVDNRGAHPGQMVVEIELVQEADLPASRCEVHFQPRACHEDERYQGVCHTAPAISHNKLLEKQVEEHGLDFDDSYNLDGNTLVRLWGHSSTATQDVACITVHPSDMVEYSTPSLERCTLLFAPKTSNSSKVAPCVSNVIDATTVQEDIVLYIIRKSRDLPPTSSFDRRLLRLAALCGAQSDSISVRDAANVALTLLQQTSNGLIQQQSLATDRKRAGSSGHKEDMEICRICHAEIPFGGVERAMARCEKGHTYCKFLSWWRCSVLNCLMTIARCTLSLFAIQEPGVSKYCSRCERQYLKAEGIKRRTENEEGGPSLVASLFEEFDRCPYCRAKFRG